jgi:transposase-like protein
MKDKLDMYCDYCKQKATYKIIINDNKAVFTCTNCKHKEIWIKQNEKS